MAELSANLYATLTYVDSKRLECAAENCTNVVLDRQNKVEGVLDTSHEPDVTLGTFVKVYFCNECMEQHRQGISPRWSTPAVNPFEEANEAMRQVFPKEQ